jgi:hypothetical protein
MRQRHALRDANEFAAKTQQILINANNLASTMSRLRAEQMGRTYKTRYWKVWVWFRNRIVWRLGCLIPGNSAAWNKRIWYDKGQREALRYFYGVKK